ncbi:MAG: preprotein translocase subunit SecA [Armatimonadota bacterium]|nr:preprotein translocase subunit SecA [Armatimonadota bacterium]MDR7439744.1 preprotein translocase subunit SecA [Armatimonadota bacterium]MDR7563085.1 preprotein translocase subunit SecA [Armatimonadota bacterium]MDR7566943.1 preprotein translocase subunit SecA [Armatimonadota bacterium]MDR7600999.1 preprotein translocase subunit SecA [Armatimonadota bacterium]
MLRTLAKLFGRGEEAAVRRFLPLVQRINELEPAFERLSDEALRAKTEEFRTRLRSGETLDDLLPEAFAAVREASKRTIGLRHFDVQLIGGIVLHESKVAEMKTGEGKTLVATLPVYLNALLGRGVHVVTVNDYLSRRDAGWMGPIYHALGLRVAAIAHDFSGLYDPAYQDPKPHADDRLNHFRPISRREAYLADVTYGTNNEFGFDYLRDNMALHPEDIVQRELYYAIVDEVDFILIDEARTPLIISGQVEKSTRKYYEFARLVRRLRPGEDYTVDEKLKTATLTEAGIRRVEQMLGVDNLTDPEHLDLMHHVHQALRAHACYKRDVDYVVKDGQVIIVDEFTGRLMFGRRYADGLHQAIEAKEGVRIERETQTLATITLQNYFRMYEKLAGMTGTAKTEEEELRKIYGLEVVVIPTHRPMIRVDHPDLVFKTEAAKWRAVVREIKECYQKGRPVLVGTRSIEKSEMLSRMLRQEGIPHQVLNAKYHEREAEIIAQAGRLGAVTIATNMAGRGVDILLGGNPPDPEEAEKVRQLGGLHVIGTERHEARRIDNQLRGRSGRQGDPGSSRFYVSAEDELLRLFGGERIAAIMDRFRIDEDTPIESPLLTRQIEAAQKRVEQYHFDIRKHLLEYDDVMNVQRQTLYRERRKVLFGENLRENVLDMMERVVAETVEAYCPASLPREEWDLRGMLQELEQLAPVPEVLAISLQDLAGRSREEIQQILTAAVLRAYEAKEEAVGPEVMREVERVVLLSHIDRKWIDHLYAMDELREGIGLRAYGQVSPLVEYQREAYEMFQQMLRAIQFDTVRDLLRVRVEREIPRVLRPVARITSQAGPDADRVLGALSTSTDSAAAPPKPQPVVVGAKVGRNDPCPCGSGRKYKKCCGRES